MSEFVGDRCLLSCLGRFMGSMSLIAKWYDFKIMWYLQTNLSFFSYLFDVVYLMTSMESMYCTWISPPMFPCLKTRSPWLDSIDWLSSNWLSSESLSSSCNFWRMLNSNPYTLPMASSVITYCTWTWFSILRTLGFSSRRQILFLSRLLVPKIVRHSSFFAGGSLQRSFESFCWKPSCSCRSLLEEWRKVKVKYAKARQA